MRLRSVIPMPFVTTSFSMICCSKEYFNSFEINLSVPFSSYFRVGTMRNVRNFVPSVVSNVVGVSPP